MRSYEQYMRMAIAEAQRSFGRTGPNPTVGAIIVNENNEVIATGYHRHAGAPHAEIVALHEAEQKHLDLNDCTLVVTLEPHAHHGRTPPCVEAIHRAGIQQVVFGCIDPNPRVAGKGVDWLRQHGIAVEGPVCEEECAALIDDFKLSLSQQRPYIVVKVATSLDGRIATKNGESKWITDEAARAMGRQLRSHVRAVLTGVGTIIADDPALTARQNDGYEPLRVVFDTHLKTPANAQVIAGPAPGCVIVTSEGAAAQREQALIAAGAKVWRMPMKDAHVDVLAVMRRMQDELGVMRVLLEAGPTLVSSFFDADLVDELHHFIAPRFIGGKTAPSFVNGEGVDTLKQTPRFILKSSTPIDDDLLLVWQRRRL